MCLNNAFCGTALPSTNTDSLNCAPETVWTDSMCTETRPLQVFREGWQKGMEAIFRLSDLNSHDSRGSNSVGEHFALPPLLIFIFSLTPGKKSSVETGRLKVKAAGECQDQEPFLRSINEYICGSLYYNWHRKLLWSGII